MADKMIADSPDDVDDPLKNTTNGDRGLEQEKEGTEVAALPVHDEIFPFICDNEKCGHEYDHNGFCLAANQWGYIFLSNNKHSFIGLTCPSCKNTTVRKYSLIGMDLNGKIPSDLNTFALFLTDGLLDLNENNEDNAYSVPDYVKPIAQYPQWFLDECLLRICDADIQKVVEYENKYKKKIFPRIVSVTSIYNRTDSLLYHLKDKSPPIDGLNSSDDGLSNSDIIHGLLMSLAQSYYFLGTMDHAGCKPPKNDINDYRIRFVDPTEISGEFDDILIELLLEYTEKRGDFDFGQNYGVTLFDNYIKRIYYDKGYYKSKEYYQDKWNSEEIHGKYFKNSIQKINESQLPEILTAEQIFDKFRIKPLLLKGFILNRDLPAYHADWTYLDPRGPVFASGDIDPNTLIYLNSEVEELLMMHPHLATRQPPEESAQKGETDSEAWKYAKLIFEEEKWQASITTAMEIGLICGTGKKAFSAEDVINSVYSIDSTLPSSTIEAIWAAIPDDCKTADGEAETLKMIERKERESKLFSRGELDANKLRAFPLKQKKTETRLRSIRAAVKIGIYLEQKGPRLKKTALLNRIDGFESGLTTQASGMIVKAVPGQYRFGPGKPRKTRATDL